MDETSVEEARLAFEERLAQVEQESGYKSDQSENLSEYGDGDSDTLSVNWDEGEDAAEDAAADLPQQCSCCTVQKLMFSQFLPKQITLRHDSSWMMVHDSTNNELAKRWPWSKVGSFKTASEEKGASKFTFMVSGQTYVLEADRTSAAVLDRIFKERVDKASDTLAVPPPPVCKLQRKIPTNSSKSSNEIKKAKKLDKAKTTKKCDGCGHVKTKQEHAAGASCANCTKKPNMTCRGCMHKFFSATRKTKYCLLCRTNCNTVCTKCKREYHSREGGTPAASPQATRSCEGVCGLCRVEKKESWAAAEVEW
jgi:hypothetical protein